jgi:hypothetical protein
LALVGILIVGAIAIMIPLFTITGMSLVNNGPTRTVTTTVDRDFSCPAGQFAQQSNPVVCNPLIYQTGIHDTKSCTDTTTTTTLMAGFKLNYTTNNAVSFSASVNFIVSAPSGASSITASFTLVYGTGNAPGCGAASTGSVASDTHVAVAFKQSENVELTMHFATSGLSPATTYWFDIRESDSDGSTWVVQNPDMLALES